MRSLVPIDHLYRCLTSAERRRSAWDPERREFVPWIAAHGRLARFPETAVARTRGADYRAAMPEAFASRYRRGGAESEPLYHGVRHRSMDVCWAAVCAARRVAIYMGQRTDDGFSAPISVFQLPSNGSYALGQAGSYVHQIPAIKNGMVTIYRGIARGRTHTHATFSADPAWSHSPVRQHVAALWYDYWAYLFLLSGRIFSRMHDGVYLGEFNHVAKDRTFDDFYCIALPYLHKARPAIPHLDLILRAWLARAKRPATPYTLSQSVAQERFGPHYVSARTPVTNLAITTAAHLEKEVHLINPELVTDWRGFGCAVHMHSLFADLTEPHFPESPSRVDIPFDVTSRAEVTRPEGPPNRRPKQQSTPLEFPEA